VTFRAIGKTQPAAHPGERRALAQHYLPEEPGYT
jgi:hypothetical protein